MLLVVMVMDGGSVGIGGWDISKCSKVLTWLRRARRANR